MTTRQKITWFGVSDIAAPSDATPKITSPADNTPLRPKRSPTLPITNKSPANTTT